MGFFTALSSAWYFTYHLSSDNWWSAEDFCCL